MSLSLPTFHHYPSFRYYLLWVSISSLADCLCLPLCVCVPLFLDPVPLYLSRFSRALTTPPPTCCCSLQGPSGGTRIHPAQPTSDPSQHSPPPAGRDGIGLVGGFLFRAWLPFLCNTLCHSSPELDLRTKQGATKGRTGVWGLLSHPLPLAVEEDVAL